MAKEIERKFLVKSDAWRKGRTGTLYRQGYLSTDPQRTVRVRRVSDRASVTIKGPTRGISRDEYQYAIPVGDAERMLETLCLRPLIEKTRYVVEHGGRRWEVDVFAGANQGLVLAEIELDREDEDVDLPPWVGDEVSDDPKYCNANMVGRPFADWS